MNKSKGNMYPFVTHTWNPIRGKCPHDCDYCYMKIFKVGELRLDLKALDENLGSDNYIFVGSATDMFAEQVPSSWIKKVLNRCKDFKNKYLFQSKNPQRFAEFKDYFPPNCVLGTTIETNWCLTISKAPLTSNRITSIIHTKTFNKTMISIEPVIDFDRNILLEWIKLASPEFVSIGADSQNHHLQEPKKEDIEWLIGEMRKFTEVVVKDNLRRLL
jgi:DNA repair photolyase